jgi:hypothetical protein
MDIITMILLGALVLAFIGAVLTNKVEFCILSLLLTFCSFIAIAKDTAIEQDLVMLLYVPIIAIGLFTVSQFFKVKV